MPNGHGRPEAEIQPDLQRMEEAADARISCVRLEEDVAKAMSAVEQPRNCVLDVERVANESHELEIRARVELQAKTGEIARLSKVSEALLAKEVVQTEERVLVAENALGEAQ